MTALSEERLASYRRLRDEIREEGDADEFADAVDEIDRLRAENERLRAALTTIVTPDEGVWGACDGFRLYYEPEEFFNCRAQGGVPQDASEHAYSCAVGIAYHALNPEVQP